MDLKTRMAVALILLFGLVFAFGMALVTAAQFAGIISGIWIIIVPLLLAIFVVVLQWALSPYIIQWVYHITWTSPEAYGPRAAEFIRTTCEKYGIQVPKCGIVEDSNPNAFTFGWTRNRAHLVLTRGILKYCDEEETIAVIGHELGHIRNNDFVVMTLVAAVPLIFYVIARGGYYYLRHSGGGGRGAAQAKAVIGVAALIAFLMYLLSNLIAMLVSRYREYYADQFSGEATGNPNKLASALIKIAYGMATEGLGKKADEKKYYKHEVNTLGIFNPTSARALAASAVTADGKYSVETIKKAMAWDMWNPWAWFLELKMTHPLPAKRILALGKQAQEMGQSPFIEFDLKKPESYWDDFARDILMQVSPVLMGVLSALLAGYVCYYYLLPGEISLVLLLFVLSAFLVGAGLFWLVYLVFYKYPKPFEDSEVADLITDPKASPIRGTPVRLHGKIIGRGQPGLFYSEDLKLDDGSGQILLDYNQLVGIINLLVGIFFTRERIGKRVTVEGWYRRYIVPYVDLYAIYDDSGKRIARIWARTLRVGGALFVLLLGLLLLYISMVLAF